MTEVICIVCPKGCHMEVSADTVTGNECDRGIDYGKKELFNPTRVLTSTVRIKGAVFPRLPVKTGGDISKRLLFDAMRVLDGVTATAPVKLGDVLLSDICGTGVDIVATRDMPCCP